MLKYSLAEMLYWLTVWTVGMSLLTAAASAQFALFVVTVWFFGTVALGKALGYVASVAYAIGTSFVVCLVAFLTESWSEGPLNFLPDIIISSLICSVIGGGIVWLATVVADETFKWLVRRRSG